MSKTIGWLFIGGTLAMAALDGALIAMLVAAGIAVWTYAEVNKCVRAPAESIYARKEREYKKLMTATTDREKLRQYRDELKQLREQQVVDFQGISNASLIVAAAAFNTPVVALSVGAYKVWQARNAEQPEQPVRQRLAPKQLAAVNPDLPLVYPDGIVRDNDAVLLQRPT